MNSVLIFTDLDALAEAMARRLRDETQQAANDNRVYSLVLTGGVTASVVYKRFAAPGFGDRIPWESVHLFWTDERCVPPESEESNFRTASRAFLNSISIPEENIHRMKGEADPAVESVRYARDVQEHLAQRNTNDKFFDWVLMGVGPDGHTASLFPGQEKLLQSSNLCEVARHPDTDQNRLTLTPAAIQRSACITYHIIGQKKADLVSALVAESPHSKNYPAAHIPGEWYLDTASASRLKPS